MTRGTFVDIAGKQFGQLVAVKHLGYGKWLCECSCGNTTITSGGNLRCGIVRSCGCIKSESSRRAHTKHGTLTHDGAVPHLYTVWTRTRSKCYSERSKSYKNFGGRGIGMCDEWRDDYATFREWAIIAGYSDNKEDGKYSLVRLDKSLDYGPDNCEWAPAGTFDLEMVREKCAGQKPQKAVEIIELDGEEWRPVAETNGRYEVSNLGRVRSTYFKNGSTEFSTLRLLSPTDNGHGYKIVSMIIDGKRRNRYVHRLVAEAFIPNPDNLPVIDHIDCNKSNNNVDNLRWYTQLDNVRRSIPVANSGKRHVWEENGRFRLSIAGNHLGYFSTLEAAVAERDRLLATDYADYQFLNEMMGQ